MEATVRRWWNWRRWLPPLLTVYAAALVGSGIALLGARLCSTLEPSLLLWLSAPLLVAIGFVFAVMVLVFFDTVPLIISAFGLGILAAILAVLGLSARAALHGDEEGRWPVLATLLFLSGVAVLSGLCTVSTCLTTTI